MKGRVRDEIKKTERARQKGERKGRKMDNEIKNV